MPKLGADEFAIEDLGVGKDGKARVNILYASQTYKDIVKSKSGKYWLKLSDNRYHWVEEPDIDKALTGGFIPKGSKSTTIALKQSSDSLSSLSSSRPVACINYLCKHIRDPKIDARTPFDSDPIHTYDISMLVVSCKSLGQFMEEVQAYMPDTVKTPDSFDWSYLNDPDHVDTANDIKLKTWYTRIRAKCKVILSKMQLCLGSLQKSSYGFFLERCFKEFVKPETSKKSASVNIEQPKSDESKSDEPVSELPNIQISFTEEVSSES